MRRLNGHIDPPLKPPRAVFFDWDGTLVDSLAFLTKIHNAARQSLGISPELTKEEFHPYLGKPREIIFHELYGDKAEQGKDAFAHYYHANHLQDITLIDGAVDLLDFFTAQNINMGVVSNKRGDFLRLEIAHLQWDKYFSSRIVGSGDTKADKPSAVPLEYGISLLDNEIEKEAIWYIGDTKIDLHCANNAKVIGILYCGEVSNFSADHGVNTSCSQQFCIKKYAEIPPFLLQTL